MKADIQSQIDTLEQYKRSVITEAVTHGLNPSAPMKDSAISRVGDIPQNWKIKRLKYLFKFCKGLPITKDNLIGQGLPVISYGQIHAKTNNGVDVRPHLLRFVDFSYQTFYPLSQVMRGDFVFADTSEDYEGCGNCVYKRNDSLLFAGYHTIIAHSIVESDNRFFAYLFQTDIWRQQIREKVSGVKVFSITQKTLSNTYLILPPLDEQQEIADYLDNKCAEIEQIIADKKSQIETLDGYKKSLIFEYVTGKKEVV
ncbi:MAG: restriction endonuclease subunit S [Firmicutes bacterium]|nr:restriction endonuclease subunit S [Bacillota bacterium]